MLFWQIQNYIFLGLCLCMSVMTKKIPDVILTPDTNLSKTSALIIAPGFGIGADAYEPLGKI